MHKLHKNGKSASGSTEGEEAWDTTGSRTQLSANSF
jgi:hypothetical protein